MRGWLPVGVGCTVSAAAMVAIGCVGQPSPDDVWSRPARSGVHDAHASISGSGGGVTFEGEGTVVFKPRLAMSLHLQTRLGALPAALDVLKVDGVTYQRVGTDQRWAVSATTPPDPTWLDTTGPRLVRQEVVGGDPAWHLSASRAGSPLDMWVRLSDGYPLRVRTSNRAGSIFTFTFDRFNAGARVDPPAAADVQPPARRLSGRVGDVLELGTAAVGVLDVDPDAEAPDDLLRPRPGNRFVVVRVIVTNTGHEDISTVFDWRLADASGYAWAEALPVRQPSFPGGELEPGASAEGFLTYEVSRSASGLALSVRVGDDTATFGL